MEETGSLTLGERERAMLAGEAGEGAAAAMRLVADAARLLGARRLVPVASAHIDGCLYHGDAGTLFAEHLVALGASVAVPATLNIGALDLMKPGNVRMPPERRAMALRLMQAYQALGCRSTFTCAPYQAGHRPAVGEDVAWGESNAVAFCNSVLGARTNRYGDFLDIACAIAGAAPAVGLHLPQNRRARLVLDASALPDRLKDEDAFWPVLGALTGRKAGERVPAITGLEGFASEDRLKALGAAAASFGAVGLFHVVGETPEAPTLAAALDGADADVERLTMGDIGEALALLSTATGADEAVSAVGIGSPHLSLGEFEALIDTFAGRRARLPFYANTGRHVVAELEARGHLPALDAAGVTLVADTCIVATRIIPAAGGVLMTNSGKFAHYAPGNIGHAVIYGSLADCVETAVAGTLRRDLSLWS
ncbi:aconitase X [Acuticoccus mangrovi]|uniref:Aconitase X catalytic domain-containing protein n=1 Tax=Acuticoccus mangrovi TaxID=2796142 RepID=A0A934IJI5_9HYPH|nr:aconitase X catalytic domain-containing protein [Acuticoccus mangrovi]MBJ3776161.1 aconitase X catalytic domain-containing protein [Acuticoccus mangrovi]